MLDIASLVKQIKSTLPMGSSISLHEPRFAGKEWLYVKDCLDTGWVSSVGKYVDSFEIQLAEFTGVKRAVAVVNGTAALHLCLKLVGVDKEDEVIVPALTFIATANAVSYCGAIPHFVDSEEQSLGIDAQKLRDYLLEVGQIKDGQCFNKNTGRRIKAVVPMHTFGHPVDLDLLSAVCNEFSLELVEDTAESLGSYYKGKHTGHWGKVSALSFNGNKVVTTGGGGAILTNDEEIGRLAKHLTTQAKLPHKWEFRHDAIGYNYRMPNINAALGCAQLEQLPDFLKAKRWLAQQYKVLFATIDGVTFVTEPKHTQSNYWLNAILIAPKFASQRDNVLAALHQEGILARPAWEILYRLPMYAECPRMNCSTAESIVGRLINLPSSVYLGMNAGE